MLFRSQTVTVERDTDGSAVLQIDVPDRSVNVFNRQVLTDLDAALDAIAAESDLPVLAVRSGKKSGFIAGADLHEFLHIADAASAEAISMLGQEVFGKLAHLPMPTVAVIHGPCLGGGLELALACDYRLVFDRPSTQLGLPEVSLGLLPGWGGSQRLPRIVGLERGLRLILESKRLSAREAQAWGLADALAADEGGLRERYSKLLMQAIGRGKRSLESLPLRTWRQWLLESNPVGRRVLFKATERALHRKVPDDMPAPMEALEAIRTGIQQGMTAGLAQERAAAGRLAMTPACRNLIGLFFQTEKARKLPDELRAAGPVEVERVGVVGAGVMGAGIAQLAAIKGCSVVVQEINQAALDAGMERIRALLGKAAERGVISPAEMQSRLAAIRGTTSWEGFDHVEVVVEAAIEELQAKRAIFHQLAERTRPTAVLATNTSSLRVELLQEGIRDPERVAGLHFFNPVHKMPLIEVARAPASSDRTMATLTQLAIKLGKMPVLVRDSAGFVVNRILMPYLNEATLLVAEGLPIDGIDRVMKRFGMPMGPLELLDQIGLDVAAHVADSMQPLLARRFEANPAFERMRAEGWLGQKKDRGFYLYHGKGKPTVNTWAATHLAGPPAEQGAVSALPMAARLSEARERMVLLMVNEAALALSEGLTATAEAIDLAMILGTGWAPHRGGPLHYVDNRGLSEVVQALQGLAGRHGARFRPCAELLRRAEHREPFTQMTPALV
jgi:3-hydroxyacyl-CoA dehydrogenase/enoyl-CoA hydratase/3-hydroxybutyryl-CoA epimerase